MKRVILMLCTITVVFIAQSSVAAEIDYTCHTGFSVDLWRSDRGERGMQSFVPLEIEGRYGQFSLRMLSALVNTRYYPDEGDTRTLTNFVDTKVNASYEILGKWPVDVLFGLDFNLPTGKTGLSQDELELIMDPDLVTITSLGEGFNVNPTVTVAKEWGAWVAGLSVGYLWRGSYDYSEDTEDYDPGDIFTLTGEVDYDFLAGWQARVFAQNAYYAKDTVQGADYYQEGDFILVGLGLTHTAGPWQTGLTLRGIWRDKSTFEEEGLFEEETLNSHGDEWIADLTCRYAADPATTLKGLMQFLWIDDNDYPRGSSFFIGKRKKYTIGIGVARALNASLAGECTLKGFIVDDDENWYHPDSGRRYEGFSAVAALTGTF